MSKEEVLKTAKEMAEYIKKNHKARDVILFGSYAYGNPGPDSDVDIMVISSSGERTIKQAAEIYSSISGAFEARFPLDIVVRNDEYMKAYPSDSMLKKALAEGVRL